LATTSGLVRGAKARDPWSIVALVFGALATAVGLWSIAAYFLEAVIARVGEPDQSLLFWYLPLLFIGIIGLILGVAAGTWGVWRRKRRLEQAPPADAPAVGDRLDR